MSNARLLVLVSLVLSGCAGPESGFAPAKWSWPFAPSTVASAPAAGTPGVSASRGGYARFGFDWQMSGDPEIMPLQVFDDGAGMWLQFPPEGAWPAVFDVRPEGRRPLTYRREPPYMILDGVYEHLELRGGHLQGSVQRVKAVNSLPAAQTERREQTHDVRPENPSVVQAMTPDDVLPAQTPDKVRGAHRLTADMPLTPAQPAVVPLAVPGTGVSAVAPDLKPAAETVPGGNTRAGAMSAPFALYAVSPADYTIRQALERWARLASWTFSAEHWAVDVDIPLVGEATFETDFKSAVRELLAATEMGDRPLQPCFYSNRVLRVVSYAQVCDRRAGVRAVS